MSGPVDTRRVWDLPVRVVHWLLVLGIAGSYATHKLGVQYFRYHLWCGYLVVILAAFRILWGFVGTRHARFTSFVRGPRTTLAYLAGLVRGRPAKRRVTIRWEPGWWCSCSPPCSRRA